MFQVRIHGRGGQGVVTAAEMLSIAAFVEGRHAQAFPELRLGAHRRAGGGVLPHRRQGDPRPREPISEPDALIIQDPTLLHQVDLFGGLSRRRLHPDQLDAQLRRARPRRASRAVPARAAAHACRQRSSRAKHLGRPLPNAALLGGFAALTGLISLDVGRGGDPPEVPRHDRREERRPPPGRRSSTSRRETRGAGSCLSRRRARSAVAEAVALCRPRGDLRLSDLAPDAHRRGACPRWSGPASSTPCEFINVESEFAAMSVAIGASAAGARTYTATASQGLLYMAEAVYNASGLGLPIVMTIANRAIGAPINIWNDHSRQHVAARLGLDPALRRDQPGGARPAHPGVPARRGALAAGDGVHGRLHPHPRVRARRRAGPGAGRRLPAAVRAAAAARSGRPGDDRRDGRPRGIHRGEVPRARQADAGARRDPADRGRVRGGVRARVGRAGAHATAPRTPRRSSSRSAR